MPLTVNPFRGEGRGLWLHRDGVSIAEAIAEGMGRAARRDWQSGPLSDRTRAFLALQVERAMLMASIGGTIERDPRAGIAALINPSPLPNTPPERLKIMRALYRTPELLMLQEERARLVVTQVGPSDTGFVVTWPIAAIAVVVVVAGAAAIGYVANQASQIIDRSLARDEDAQRLAQRDAETMKIIREHQEQEQKQGKPLPLSEPARLALEALLEQQAAIVQKQDAPLDAGPFGAGGASLFSGVTGILLGIGGGYLLSKAL